MNIRERLHRLDGRRQKILLLFVWLVLVSVLWVWWDERTLPDIRGSWASAACEQIRSDEGVSRVRRSMRLDDASWRLTIDFFGDEGCATELFSLEIEGPYDIGPKSMTLLDATTARFELRKLTLTPRSSAAAAAFTAAGCGAGAWQVGEGQEVTERGCLDLTPTVESCPVEYDIVKVEGDRLYFGDRSKGMCVFERYPDAFAPDPLYRQEL